MLLRNFFKISLPTLVLITVVVISGCTKDEVVFTSSESAEKPSLLESGESVITTICGTILDENNDPVIGAKVTLGDNIQYTNEYGVFCFDQASCDSKYTFIKVSKAGYFDGFRSFKPSKSGSSALVVKLLPKVEVATISNDSGGSVSISGGAKLTFEPQDVSLQDGQNYSGDIHVYAQYLDPTNYNTFREMPGDLSGVDQGENEVILQTYGMISVQLETPDGTPLKVTENESVDITIPIPSELLSGAPSVIPLWYFDEDLGYWKEEGNAVLNSDQYIGSVKHFSFWNCDKPYEGVDFECILSCDGSPLSYQEVVLHNSENGDILGYSMTDAKGRLDEKVPAGIPLELRLYSACDESAFDLGVIDAPTDAGVLEVCELLADFYNVSGYLYACGGTVADFSVLTVKVNEQTYSVPTDEDGYVNVSIVACDPEVEIEIIGLDFDNMTSSEPVYDTINSDLDFGNLYACAALEIEPFHCLDADGQCMALNYDGVYSEMDNAIIVYLASSSPYYLVNGVPGVSIQIADEVVLGINPIDLMGIYDGTSLTAYECLDISLEITQIESLGGYVKGKFQGPFTYFGEPHYIAGSFCALHTE